MRRRRSKISFTKFFLIFLLFIMMIIGIGLVASGDKKSGRTKTEYYISGGVILGFSLFIFFMGKLTGLITLEEIIMTLAILGSFDEY